MTTAEITRYYERTAAENEALACRLTRRMNALAVMRLALAAGWIAALILLRAAGFGWITAAFALPFTILMVAHERLSKQKRYAAAWADLCRNELRGLDGDHTAFDGAAERADGGHPYSLDLDIFGPESLFQALDRTVTRVGADRLADALLDPIREKPFLLVRQQATGELARDTPLRHRFQVAGNLNPGGRDDVRRLQALTAHDFPFTRQRFWKSAIWIVPAIWVALIPLLITGIVPLGAALLFYGINTVLAYAKFRQISALQNSLDRVERTLSVYARLIALIEQGKFESPLLREIQGQLSSGSEKIPASQVVRRLSRRLDALNQRTNLVLAMTLNVFLLRDIRIAIRLEQWKRAHAAEIPRWFDALGTFDALCSQGTFAFNHPEYPYPTIADDYFTLTGKGLGHPLMRAETCVRNDVEFRSAPELLIVTGANMAGKSTYLRTVGVNFVLACAGMPVCAEELTLYPAALATSLRTSDSLARGESYFFAELKRLKTIIDRLRTGEKLFIVLDEILKGTNSADKQKGSLALVRQFVGGGTCGIIATHDLALGTLADEFPGAVRNARFEGEIHGEQLTFSYRLQHGVARNLNATFLMERMGITV